MMRLTSKLGYILKEEKGSVSISTSFFIIFIVMVIAVVYEYLNVFTIVQGVHDFTYQAIISTATDNAYNTYQGVKEGNTYAVEVSTEELRSRLISTMELDNNMQKIVGGKLKFKISNLQIQYIEVSKGATGNSTTLSFSATLTLTVPLQLGNDKLGNITKPLLVKATYIPLF